MDSDKLNRWLTLGANVGVVVGIILLLIELSQTQEIARAQTRNEVFQGLTDVLAILDRDTAEVIVRANAGEELNPTDQMLIGRWSESMLRYWENSDYQFSIGMYDKTEYSAQKITIKTTILEVFPGALIPHYCQGQLGFSENFRLVINEFITQETCVE